MTKLAEEYKKNIFSSRTHHPQLLKAPILFLKTLKTTVVFFVLQLLDNTKTDKTQMFLPLSLSMFCDFSVQKENSKPYYMRIFWQVMKKMTSDRLSENGGVVSLKKGIRVFAKISALEEGREKTL